ncbi:MAG TPA: alpha/beta fold hydrolase [Aeromicrobium sp.]|nr:alpha/beta fold hydrolase [Aeromicrobium sp.]HKY58038.1 alpha/beta fold hydrolase [Aeromicrobium sp.]
MSYDSRHTPGVGSGFGTGLLEHAPQPGVVRADDGRDLSITVFEPVRQVRGVAIVASAMATPAAFYTAFARRLSEHGIRTVTFDYRTVAGTPEQMRREDADVDRWSADAAAVLESVAADADRERLPITWIGHSLGGQIIPFVDHRRLTAIVTIASGDGYWRRNAPALRRKVPLLWWVTAPVAMAVTGYFPGRRLGLGGDLPSGVLKQWSRWCRHPGYLQADHPDARELFAAVRTPITALSFSDDEVLSPESTRFLHAWYTGSHQDHRVVRPSDVGVERIGHHGFFRKQHAHLWDELVVPAIAVR